MISYDTLESKASMFPLCSGLGETTFGHRFLTGDEVEAGLGSSLSKHNFSAVNHIEQSEYHGSAFFEFFQLINQPFEIVYCY